MAFLDVLPTVMAIVGAPVPPTVTAWAKVAVSSMMSPTFEVLVVAGAVGRPLVTVTVGAVRLMLTPATVTAGTVSA